MDAFLRHYSALSPEERQRLRGTFSFPNTPISNLYRPPIYLDENKSVDDIAVWFLELEKYLSFTAAAASDEEKVFLASTYFRGVLRAN